MLLANEQELHQSGYIVLYDRPTAQAIYLSGVDVKFTDLQGTRWPLARAVQLHELANKYNGGGVVVWFPQWAVAMHTKFVRELNVSLHVFTKFLLSLKDNPERQAVIETVARLGDMTERSLIAFIANDAKPP